jgi:predicted nucleotidyltransferase
MGASELASLLPAIEAVARRHEHLKMLVLFGSRARGETHEGSDWDLAYLASAGFDVSSLYADLAMTLRTDKVDLVDLAAAGGLIRYRVARDGIVIMEREPGTFDKFWFEAVSFWCDAEPVLRAGYASILEGLGP